MRVAFHCKLFCHTFRQRSINCSIFTGKFRLYPIVMILGFYFLSFFACKQVIQFCYKTLDCRDKFDESFRNKNRTEIVSVGSTVCNCLSYICYYFVQRSIVLLHFFRNNSYVRMTLQSTFKSNM